MNINSPLSIVRRVIGAIYYLLKLSIFGLTSINMAKMITNKNTDGTQQISKIHFFAKLERERAFSCILLKTYKVFNTKQQRHFISVLIINILVDIASNVFDSMVKILQYTSLDTLKVNKYCKL